MNPLAKILIFLAVVVGIALFLSPPIFWGVQALGEAGMAFGLESHPFHRFFSRITQISALVLIVPLIWWLRVRSVRELGIYPNPLRWRDLGVGIALAVVPVLLLAAVYIPLDILRWRSEIGWGTLPRIFATATFVSVFEEFLFRGVLLGLAIRSIGVLPGIAVVSAAFSAVHFIKPKGIIPAEDVTWWSGFELLRTSVDPDLTVSILIGGLITLFVIGWITGAATVRTRSLWLAIGLHAGWILVQQSVNLALRFRIRPPDALMPWVGPNVVSGMVPTGIVPVAVLLVTGALVWWYLARGPHRTAPPGL